ncbi:MAG: hypothetical protein BAJATHORv1_20667 [Candidatus Thorarchaeota archaeon]|nr:MAG: hypothetical protein BAJATHORv1_20667 [Candidatus Thorarchaeota archaeon]
MPLASDLTPLGHERILTAGQANKKLLKGHFNSQLSFCIKGVFFLICLVNTRH